MLIFRKIYGYTTQYKSQTSGVRGVGCESESNHGSTVSLTFSTVRESRLGRLPPVFNQVSCNSLSLLKENYGVVISYKPRRQNTFDGTRHIQLKHLCHIYIYIYIYSRRADLDGIWRSYMLKDKEYRIF